MARCSCDIEPQRADRHDQPDPNRHDLDFRGVNKWFGALNVLKDITLQRQPREVVVVCRPERLGQVDADPLHHGLEAIKTATSLSTASASAIPPPTMTQLRHRIGFVFQSFNLYPHKTALET